VVVVPIKGVRKAPQVRTWRVSIFRKKLQRVGRVHAIDQSDAERVAAAEFALKDHERSRLLIEEVV
jgi:hypothetical protein